MENPESTKQISLTGAVNREQEKDPIYSLIKEGFSTLNQKIDKQNDKIDEMSERVNSLESIFEKMIKDYFIKVSEQFYRTIEYLMTTEISRMMDVKYAEMKLHLLEETAKMISKEDLKDMGQAGVNYSQLYTEMIEPILEEIKGINLTLNAHMLELNKKGEEHSKAILTSRRKAREDMTYLLVETESLIEKVDRGIFKMVNENFFSLDKAIAKRFASLSGKLSRIEENAGGGGLSRKDMANLSRSIANSRYGSMNT